MLDRDMREANRLVVPFAGPALGLMHAPTHLVTSYYLSISMLLLPLGIQSSL